MALLVRVSPHLFDEPLQRTQDRPVVLFSLLRSCNSKGGVGHAAVRSHRAIGARSQSACRLRSNIRRHSEPQRGCYSPLGGPEDIRGGLVQHCASRFAARSSRTQHDCLLLRVQFLVQPPLRCLCR